MCADASAQPRASQAPGYDVNTEVTIRGTVQEVTEVTAAMRRRNLSGTHLIVKTDAESVNVHLGPSAFLAEQKLALAAGDSVQIVGSRVAVADGQAVLAREVRKGDLIVTLRDAQGFPKWSNRGRR